MFLFFFYGVIACFPHQASSAYYRENRFVCKGYVASKS